MKYERPVTPAALSPALEALCRELSPTEVPQYVEVVPIDDMPPDECFPLVEAYVQHRGGERYIGWSLWELPTLFVEAEFHAVWRSPDSELFDITPKRTPTARILFLPDPVAQYAGVQVNNVRRPLSQDPKLLRYLRTFDERFAIMNRGERMNQHGMIKLTAEESDEYHALVSEGQELYFELWANLAHLGVYDPCPCGSGRKVRWCHKANDAG